MRAAIYARVSTSDGGQNPDNQLKELRRFATTQGWTVVQEYVDHETGKTANRAAFRRLFLDAAKRKFDVVPLVKASCKRNDSSPETVP